MGWVDVISSDPLLNRLNFISSKMVNIWKSVNLYYLHKSTSHFKREITFKNSDLKTGNVGLTNQACSWLQVLFTVPERMWIFGNTKRKLKIIIEGFRRNDKYKDNK